MKIAGKILKWVSVSLLSLLTLLVLYVWFVYFARPGAATSLTELEDQEWHTIPLGGKTLCSDGSEYAIFARKGNSNNLMIHFSGGGACWDDMTCAKPIHLSNILDEDTRDLKAFYFPALSKIVPKVLVGLIDFKDPTNYFKDWNIVFIPYCTGDLHIGNVVNTYRYEDRQFQIHHNGRNNTLASLDWIFENFRNPDKIMVSGESAGAYASAFWTPYVARHYVDGKIYQLSDGALMQSMRWKEILDTVWRSDSESFLHFRIEKDIFEDAILRRTDTVDRRIKYLHSNTLYDMVLPRFSAVLNSTPTRTNEFIDNWSQAMVESMRRLKDSGLDYQYFISDCEYDSLKHITPHTLTNVKYSSCLSDSTSFSNWLTRNVIEDKPLSAGSRFLPGPVK